MRPEGLEPYIGWKIDLGQLAPFECRQDRPPPASGEACDCGKVLQADRLRQAGAGPLENATRALLTLLDPALGEDELLVSNVTARAGEVVPAEPRASARRPTPVWGRCRSSSSRHRRSASDRKEALASVLLGKRPAASARSEQSCSLALLSLGVFCYGIDEGFSTFLGGNQMVGKGSTDQALDADAVRDLLAAGLGATPLDGQRVLVLIPDGTRNAPIPLLFRLLNEALGPRVECLTFLIALGTHSPMSVGAIDRLVGMTSAERRERFPKTEVLNHMWNQCETLTTIGIVEASEVADLTGGLACHSIPVTINRAILAHDRIVICGPVAPHEVAGFSGGAKYLFPGIAGADIINSSHWLGALWTSMRTIGVKDTPVRRVIHRAAALVPRPIDCIAMVVKDGLRGLYVGDYQEAWNAAADLSAQVEIVNVPKAYRRIISIASNRYADLWTAAKAMYKTEAAVADGGEVVVVAPHVTEVSYMHGDLIDEVGYHVRDYFTKQPERFDSIPGMIKAHSSHVKGAGAYDAEAGVEAPRIEVSLATGIPHERCRRVNLGYVAPTTIDLEELAADDDVLVVRNAGEMLYKVG